MNFCFLRLANRDCNQIRFWEPLASWGAQSDQRGRQWAVPCSGAAWGPGRWGTHREGDPGRLRARSHIGMVLFSQRSGEPVGTDAGKPLAPWGAPRPQAGLALGDVWTMLERQDGVKGSSL